MIGREYLGLAVLFGGTQFALTLWGNALPAPEDWIPLLVMSLVVGVLARPPAPGAHVVRGRRVGLVGQFTQDAARASAASAIWMVGGSVRVLCTVQCEATARNASLRSAGSSVGGVTTMAIRLTRAGLPPSS